MDEDLQIGICFANPADLFRSDLLMDVAEAIPRDDVLVRDLLRDVVREIAIRNEEDVLALQRPHDLRSVRRCHDDVGQGFHRGGRVDVAHDREIGMFFAKLFDLQREIFGRRRVRELAAGQQVRQKHGSRRIDDLRRLGHEVNAREFDDVSVLDIRRHQGQFERVPDEVRDFQDLRSIVVVGDDHRVALLLERADLVVKDFELPNIFFGVFVCFDSAQFFEERGHIGSNNSECDLILVPMN